MGFDSLDYSYLIHQNIGTELNNKEEGVKKINLFHAYLVSC